ncbi:MAG: hypothetical protein JNM93_07925 [Bacteriovoracaceae bacterium]|nr:hypothetical protein [Bacteriovoracaceae bacterium]
MMFLNIVLMTFLAQAQTFQEKEMENIDFKELKNVLKEDFLEPVVEQKIEKVKEIKEQRQAQQIEKFNYPTEENFWGFISEYWLVKNASILKWDFEKPDYGLEGSVAELFEKLGLYQKKFKILPLNTPVVAHFSVPGNDGEMIYLISVPFLRSLDLNKLEISLLILEDYFRQEMAFFRANVNSPELAASLGQNFHNKKVSLKFVDDVLNNYTKLAFDSGYTFQQQFEVTKKMDLMLKSHPQIWNVYFQLLSKIDKLVKTNSAYEIYNKIYPSPEMQIKWLSPKEKVL